MSTYTREGRLERRISDLYATDQQFAAARPSEVVAHTIESPDLGLPQIVQTVLAGYFDRPHERRAAPPVRHDHLPRAVGPRQRGLRRPDTESGAPWRSGRSSRIH